MSVKTIKGIEDATWAEFKSLAAKNSMKTGQFFTKMVEDARSKDVWSVISSGKSFLSKAESTKMREVCSHLRKEWGYRDDSF